MTGTFDEAMLRERFESALADLSPDIVRLVADGAAEGRGLLRRRRIVSGLAAAAVAIVAVGSITYASQSGLLGQGDDHATNNGLVVQLVPATPRGLAAALMSHTEDLGTPFAVGGTKMESDGAELSGQIAYRLSGGAGLELDVYATTDMSAIDETACQAGADPTLTVCRRFALPDGTRAWYVEYATAASGSDESQGVVSAVIALREDQAVAVVQTMADTTDFALDQSRLAEIVSDPAIGLSTTEAFNALGDDIPDFKVGGLITSDSGSGSATAPAPAPTTQSAQNPATTR